MVFKGNGVLEPARKFEERYNVGIVKVVAKPTEGAIPVRLFNLSPIPKTIFHGSTVGEFYPLFEEGNQSCPDFCYFIATEKGGKPAMCSAVGCESTLPPVKQLFPIDNPSLTEHEKESVYEILERHPAVISGSKSDLGEAKEVEHSIDTGDQPPIRIPPRRLPIHKRDVIKKEVEAMLKDDIIEHSYSPWSAPVVLVKKKDGTERFCIDYRKLNEITKKDVYPLPRCEEILESLADTAYFSQLGLGTWILAN